MNTEIYLLHYAKVRQDVLCPEVTPRKYKEHKSHRSHWVSDMNDNWLR